jgi:hypothetical protein
VTKREYKHNGRGRTVSLTYPLPEEQAEFEAALSGMKYRLAIEEFLEQSIRPRLKYQDLPAEQDRLLEELRAELLEDCEGLQLT